jgi:hypothetical protein
MEMKQEPMPPPDAEILWRETDERYSEERIGQ